MIQILVKFFLLADSLVLELVSQTLSSFSYMLWYFVLRVSFFLALLITFSFVGHKLEANYL